MEKHVRISFTHFYLKITSLSIHLGPFRKTTKELHETKNFFSLSILHGLLFFLLMKNRNLVSKQLCQTYQNGSPSV